MKEELGLCYEPKASVTDSAQMFSFLQNLYSDSAELNYAALRPGRAPVALPLDKIINIALTQKDDIQLLNESLWMWYGQPGSGVPCIDYRGSASSYQAVPLIEYVVFQYLTCE